MLSKNKVRRGFAPREYIVAVLSAYSHGIAKAVRTLTMHSGDARVWRPRGEFRQCGTERQTPNLSCSLVTVLDRRETAYRKENFYRGIRILLELQRKGSSSL